MPTKTAPTIELDAVGEISDEGLAALASLLVDLAEQEQEET